jgi:UDP-glucose 4-epimerase
VRVVVTGAGGFIGTNLCLSLVKNGIDFLAIDKDFKYNYIQNSFRDSCVVRDINDGISQYLKPTDVVVHLAAEGNVLDSIKNPDISFIGNIVATHNVLKDIVKSGVSKFIFSSTGGALAGSNSSNFSEDSELNPISPYGASKMSCEALIKGFAYSYDIDSIIFRFGNIYGPFSYHKEGIITKAIKFNLGVLQDVHIYGDGSSTRDYLYVDDLITVIIKSILEINSSKGVDIYHLGTGVSTSVLQVLEAIEKEFNTKKTYDFCSVNRGEVVTNSLNVNKMNSRFGEVSNKFGLGIKKTIDWYKKTGE